MSGRGSGEGTGLDDHDAEDRARGRQIRIWAVVSGVVLVAAVAILVAVMVGSDDGPDAAPTASTTPPVASATSTPSAGGADPATPTATAPAEPSATPTGEPTQPAASTPPPTGGQQTATDVFTPRLVWEPSTSAIEGAAVMGSIVEQGGSCTVVAERGGEVVESEPFRAQADAQSTVCGGLTLSSERLVAGDWQVRVHYESADAVGDSAPTTVTVG
ncbi:MULTISPECIES: hypothetical protein [unclassified Frigoribacterium]|uniref:hypothetical protein n=1 Tax=unclassified Frigoribacterium TaxID=2627005 RepID=UPI0006F5E694|nr:MULTISPECIES: hypothetical protein [unclassified Frigoribacterium]KQO82477.1 hypothetical protein ASF17_05205 [Frigoribacterium sp. Leaf263]KQR64839.1 hypothetical protein ASF89_10420 [Frigoribacterium sp. Leaf172]